MLGAFGRLLQVNNRRDLWDFVARLYHHLQTNVLPLTCCWALVEIECLTVGHRLTWGTSCMFPDSPSHKVGHASQQSISNTWLGLRRYWGHQQTIWRCCPKVSTHITVSTAAKQALIALVSWLRKKRLGSGLLMVLHFIQALPGSGHPQHEQLLPGTALWDAGKGNFHRRQKFWQYTWPYCLFERKHDQMCGPSLIHEAVADDLAGRWGTRMTRALLENWWERYLGRSVWIDLSKWTKALEILMFHVNAHQKVTSAEEFNIK